MHTSISDAEFTATLTGAGLPDFAVDRIVDLNANTRADALAQVRPDLERLIGGPRPVSTPPSPGCSGPGVFLTSVTGGS